MPSLAARLDRGGRSIRRQFTAFMLATLAIVCVAGVLVLSFSWPLASDDVLWGWKLVARGDDARGWVALGARPVGVVAIGMQPTGVFALGMFPIGIFSFGMTCLGVFSIGMFAVGFVSSGAGACGWLSFGGHMGSVGWYSYADEASIGAYSWGRRARGYYFASSSGRSAVSWEETAKLAGGGLVGPPNHPNGLTRWLSGASARFQRSMLAVVVVVPCCVVGMLVALGILDPHALDGGLLSWRELIASRDEPWRWISIGERPVGVVAIGQQPTGLIALGVFPVGVISIGVISVGVLSVGAAALGMGSLGLLAAGWLAVGNVSVGWYAYARGGTALGAHSWGWRAYGLVGAHRRVPPPRPPVQELLFSSAHR